MNTTRKPRTGLVRKRLSAINPSPENEHLYRPVHDDDPEIQALADSIRERGLLEPIVVTRDGYIVSGHRRHAACRLAGLSIVPCRVLPIHSVDDPDDFVRLLREYNRQREKTLAEKVREEIVSADPDEAYRHLVEHRKAASAVDVSPVRLLEPRRRSKITAAKRPMVDAALRVLDERRDFLPTTVRTIHYALLNAPPLRHASKPESTYKNDQRSYKDLDELLTRMRCDGTIPMDWIRDDTRPVTVWGVHNEPRTFVRQQVDEFLKGYYRDLMQSQPNHVEVLGEKNTVDPILRTVVGDYCIPMTTGRGYSSLPPRSAMAERYFASGKEKLILLIVSDFDPDGESICESFARSMRDDFEIENVHAIKVALTHEQVGSRDLPLSIDPKKTSSRYKRFAAQFGDKAYELEALEPGDLQQILRDAIDSVIDREAFNAEVDAERQDAAQLDTLRATVHKTIGAIELEGGAA